MEKETEYRNIRVRAAPLLGRYRKDLRIIFLFFRFYMDKSCTPVDGMAKRIYTIDRINGVNPQERIE